MLLCCSVGVATIYISIIIVCGGTDFFFTGTPPHHHFNIQQAEKKNDLLIFIIFLLYYLLDLSLFIIIKMHKSSSPLTLPLTIPLTPIKIDTVCSNHKFNQYNGQ